MEFLIALVLIAILTLYLYCKQAFKYWEKKGVPQATPTFPFGNSKDVVLQNLNFGENILNIYKKEKIPGRRFVGIYFFIKPELIILDPELVKNIMTKDFQYFSDRGIHYDEKRDPLTAHLLSLEGEKWKVMRQKLTPTFSSGRIKEMFHTLINCSHGLSEILDQHTKKQQPIDIKEIAGRFTTDIIGSCAFGLECNSLKDPDNEFRTWGKKVFEPSAYIWFKRVLSFVFPKVYSMLGMTKIEPGINNFFMSIIRDTVDYREKNDVKRNDFLQLLINVRNSTESESKALTIEQIAAQSFLFFLAGFETSSTTMTFFFYDLATHQSIQNKVRQEINDMLKKYNGELTYEGIMELHYLDKVICESQRLHSAIPMITRRCSKNYKIPDSDVTIEEGTTVITPIIGFQSDPEYYPNPEVFDPERFSPEEKENRHPFTFLPFGEGPRNCIGLRFGLLQTKVGIVCLLRNHRFTVNVKTKIPFKIEPKNIIASVEGGIWLNASRI